MALQWSLGGKSGAMQHSRSQHWALGLWSVAAVAVAHVLAAVAARESWELLVKQKEQLLHEQGVAC